MRVPKGRLHLRVILMSGAVHQHRAPDSTWKAVDKVGTIKVPEGYREENMATRMNEEGGDTGAYRGGKEKGN